MVHRPLRRRAMLALGHALRRARPDLELSAAGYVDNPSDSLVAGATLELFEDDLRQGDGNELESKFRAAHSSSALAVNSFAPFKRCPCLLRLSGRTGFTSLHFERKCPTGLRGTPPNLDVLADGPDGIVAIESKCTEHLSPHPARFASAYRERIRYERRNSAWFQEMLGVLDNPERYQLLDVAQLIKHAFGLSHCFRDRPVTLLYLYWEPTNAGEVAHFAHHRDEIRQLAARVAGASPAFEAISYGELWRAWDQLAEPPWLADHLRALRQRYAIAV